MLLVKVVRWQERKMGGTVRVVLLREDGTVARDGLR